MYIIVELWGGESLEMRGDQVDLRVVWRCDRENGSEGIVGGISFGDDLCVWNPMGQYQSGGDRKSVV